MNNVGEGECVRTLALMNPENAVRNLSWRPDDRKIENILENPGIDPVASRMQIELSTT